MNLRTPLLLLVLAGMPAFAADITPGNWEIQISTTGPGVPPGAMTQNQCLRPEDAKNPGRLFGAPGPGCEFLNQRDDGKAYRFDMLCKDQNVTVSGSGEMRYAADTMEGDLVLRTVISTMTTELRSKIRARRVGPCK